MVWTRLRSLGLVWLFAAGLLPAQYPGQYPPGQYPPGQYPSPFPTPRLPIPRRGSKKNPADRKTSPKEVLSDYTGAIDKISSESITLLAPDTRIISFKCGKATKFFKDDKEIQQSVLKPGDEILIEARKDDEGYFYAVNVRLQKPAAAAKDQPVEKAAAAEEEAGAPPPSILRMPPTAPDPDDDGPPALRRGKPAPGARKASQESAPEPQPAVAAVAPSETRDPAAPAVPAEPPAPALTKEEAFIEKSRDTALDFTEKLPNYICQQMTTRYQGEGRPINWQPLDVVTAAVVYEDGKESYHNIKINNKLTNKPMEEMGGSWSKGEFGSTLGDLFSPATAALFRFRRDSTASGRAAAVYDFLVDQPHSHWQTIVGGQSVFPAYKGSIWLDRQNNRVLRIEMQARSVPEEFPLDAIEWVVEYAYVRIGTAEFLLPTHAENLSCWRGTSRCARNALDFRNYRKFTSESQIMTTDSNISFDGAEPPKDAEPAKSPKKK